MLNKHDFEFWSNSPQMHKCLQAFADQQTAAMQQEIDELKETNKILKNKQDYYWNQGDANLNNLLRAKEQVEIMKQLLEKQIRSQAYRFDMNPDVYWQSFCTENNIKP